MPEGGEHEVGSQLAVHAGEQVQVEGAGDALRIVVGQAQELERLDARVERIVHRISVGGWPARLAWTLGAQRTVRRIDHDIRAAAKQRPAASRQARS